MNNKIKEMLDEEIMSQIEEVSILDADSDEKTKAEENLEKLYRLKIENERLANEMAEKKKDRWFRAGVTVFEVGLPLIFYGVWMRVGFKFEETGSITSSVFKGLTKWFKPTKR